MIITILHNTNQLSGFLTTLAIRILSVYEDLLNYRVIYTLYKVMNKDYTKHGSPIS